MLFKRRQRPSRLALFREWIWPRSGWWRTILYVWRRASRLSGTPHSIAAGFAGGAFASFTPFVGFHFIIAIACAGVTRGNVLAGIFGTFVGNPLTFPFIWFSTFSVGKKMLGVKGPNAGTLEMPNLSMWTMMTDPVGMWEAFAEQMVPIIKPMMVGGLALGLPVWFVFYIGVRWGVRAYQASRQRRLAQRRMTVQNGGGRSNRSGRLPGYKKSIETAPMVSKEDG